MDIQRKNIRLSPNWYLGPQWYFLTACTQGRREWFSDAGLARKNLCLLRAAAERMGFYLHAFCFMPDHLHMLVGGAHSGADCLRFVKDFKQRSGYAFKQSTGLRLWQHKFYDHILRAGDKWEAVAWYIWMNPVRKGLCGAPEAWPFSGSETHDWKRLLSTVEHSWIPPWKRRAGL